MYAVVFVIKLVLFPQLPAAFPDQDVNRLVVNFAYVRIDEPNFFCPQRKLDGPRFPKLAFECESFQASNSSVSKISDRTFSIKISMDGFICL